MKKFFVGLGLAVLVLTAAFTSTLLLTGDLIAGENFLNLLSVSGNSASRVKTPEEIYREADYTVIVTTNVGVSNYFGSGVIIQWPELGFCVLTVKHAVNSSSISGIKTEFKDSNFEQPMEIIGLSENHDAALLKFRDPNFHPSCIATIGRSSELKAGSKITGIGSSPFGRFWLVTGHLYTKPSATVIVADMTVFKGFSGGPVLNESGELVGIMMSYIPLQNNLVSNGKISEIVPIDNILSDKFVKP